MELLSKIASFLSRSPGRFLISECKSTHFFNNRQMFCRENFKTRCTKVGQILRKYIKASSLSVIKNFTLFSKIYAFPQARTAKTDVFIGLAKLKFKKINERC